MSSADSPDARRCVVYSCALALELSGIKQLQQTVYRRRTQWYKDGLNTILHAWAVPEEGARSSPSPSDQVDIFFFSYGCVVTWGLEESQELQLVERIKREHGEQPLLQDEVDDFRYIHAPDGPAKLNRDTIELSTTEVPEKLAISFALAQSAKLGVFEAMTEKTIEESRDLPERMAKDGKISLDRRTITRRLGQLFVDRASINLHSDILEHPDFFWEDDEWLHAYLRVSQYLEVQRRVGVLNQRLDILKELFDMLSTEMHNMHSNKLEWIVIILILVEVVFQVLELVVQYVELY